MSGRDFFDKGPTEQQLEELRKKAEQIAMTQPKANKVSEPGPSWEKEAEEAARDFACAEITKYHPFYEDSEDADDAEASALFHGLRTGHKAGARWAQEKAAAPGEESWDALIDESIENWQGPFRSLDFYLHGVRFVLEKIATPLLKERDEARAELSSLKATEAALRSSIRELNETFEMNYDQKEALRQQLAEATKALEESLDQVHTASIWDYTRQDLGLLAQLIKAMKTARDALTKLKGASPSASEAPSDKDAGEGKDIHKQTGDKT